MLDACGMVSDKLSGARILSAVQLLNDQSRRWFGRSVGV